MEMRVPVLRGGAMGIAEIPRGRTMGIAEIPRWRCKKHVLYLKNLFINSIISFEISNGFFFVLVLFSWFFTHYNKSDINICIILYLSCIFFTSLSCHSFTLFLSSLSLPPSLPPS
jgi:hypothetical protein